jgi:membrane protein DedA with SNARE-associated domain/rhodanese-related sulfurtransferase
MPPSGCAIPDRVDVVYTNGATQLTYSGIWLAVFARQLCLPVPAVLFLMTAGALAAQGQLHVSLLLLAGVLGCLAGDGVWFWLGRRWGSRMIRLVCSLTLDPQTCMKRSRRIFDRWGLRILVVAKFVPGLDGVMPPLAGAEGASVGGFFAFDSAGSLLWTSAYLLIGFVFNKQLDRAIRVAEHFGTVLAVLVGVPLFVYVVWRLLHLVRVILHLRLRRIGPALLQRKLDESDRVAVFDLLHYEAREEDIAGIPGAIRVDPARLRSAPQLVVPDDVDIVLYCSSRNEFVSARVAEALQKRGFKNVWVLEGGLDAWVLDGRPVTMEFSTGQEVAARLGIKLPPERR